MASVKEYAYFVKGNRIAIVEKDTAFDNDVNSRDYGPGSDRAQWKSPLADVTKGLEIEYTYAPDFTLASSYQTPQQNQFYINGWHVYNGYLTFLRSHMEDAVNWNGAHYSAAADNEYILIRGSNRWNGIHKIQDGTSYGQLQTYTKVNETTETILGSSDMNITAASDGLARIHANDSSDWWLNAIFSPGDFVFVRGATNINNGVWEVDSVQSGAGVESAAGIYIKNKYFCYHGDDTLSTEGIDTTPNTSAQSNATVHLFGMHRDFCYFLTDVDVLNNESDELPVPPYLERAMVDYMRARIAEDQGELEMKEYYLKEFRKKVEQHESSKIRGFRGAVAGPHAIR